MNNEHPYQAPSAIAARKYEPLIPSHRQLLPQENESIHVSSGGNEYEIRRVQRVHLFSEKYLALWILLGLITAFTGVALLLIAAIAMKPVPVEVRVNPHCIIWCNADSKDRE